MTEELLNKIISVAYGDASMLDNIEIYLLSKKDPDIKALLEEYRETASSVHSIEKEECPEEILEIIKSKTDVVGFKEKSFFYDLYSLIISKPIFSVAATAAVIAIIVLSIFLQRPAVQYNYSTNDIELANKQTKHALAIVGKIFKETQHAIKEDILKTQVGKPIKTGMNEVNNLLNKENKNETLN